MITGSMTGAIEVVLADSRVGYRRAVRQALEDQGEQRIFVLGEAGSLSELGDLLAETHPKVILMDPQLPDTLGLDAITQVSQAYPGISIIALTTLRETRILREAVTAGARFCLLKETGPGQFVSAIQLAANAKLRAHWSEQDHVSGYLGCDGLITRPLFFTTQELS